MQATADAGKYAIGVDINQDDDQAGYVLVSKLQRTNITTFRLIEMAMSGTLEGDFTRVGLPEGVAGSPGTMAQQRLPMKDQMKW